MNWNAVIAITEVIGVIAVIASLTYLAIQIRQSTQIARANIVHGTSDSWANYYRMLAADSNLADLYRRGTLGETLTETEVIQFESLVEVFMAVLEDTDHQYKIDLYFDEEEDEDIIEFMAPTFRPLLGSPIGRDWWRRVAPRSTTPSLHKKISKIMADWDKNPL